MTKEQEIKKNMEKLHISREEAENLYISDHEEIDTPEQIEYTRKAKKIKRYEKSNTPRKKTVRERKKDTIKREIIATVAQNLTRCFFDNDEEINSISIVNPEKEITFKIGSNSYSISLTKHRPVK